MADTIEPKHVANITESPVGSVDEESYETTHAPTRDGPIATLRAEEWWKWEILGVLGSAAALIGIVIFLHKLNGHPQPQWSFKKCVDVPKTNYHFCTKKVGVSVNSVISWLSTVAKICVLIPITKGLGQLKWVWFTEKERMLSDLETFDSATRGLTGSAMLVWRLRGRHLAVLGAMGMILSLGFEPFVQNLVAYRPEYLSDPSRLAYIANASIYNTTGPYVGGKYYDVHPAMRANVYSSLFNVGSNQSWTNPSYICPSGNCTWGAIASVGVCSMCEETTSMLTRKCTVVFDGNSDTDSSSDNSTTSLNSTMKRHRRQYEGISNCTMTLPSGLETWYLTGQLADWPMVVSTAVPAQVFRNLTASSIINIQSILAKDGVREIDNSTTFIASECVLVPCVQSYHAAVNGSDFKEQILQTWYNNTQDLTAGTNLTADDNQQLFAFVDPSEAPDKGVEAGQHFGITGIAYDAVQRYLSSLFSGYAIQLRSDFEFEGTPSGIGSSDALKAIYYGNFTNCENPADKVACAVGNVAKALSKSIRDAPYVVSGVDGAEMTKGQTLVPVTYIHVTWYWLSLPVVIWLLSITTLLGTAWKSRRAGVRTWRTNPLAMVFLGLDREEHAKVKHYGMTEKALSKKAKKLQVKLHVTEEGARLVNG